MRYEVRQRPPGGRLGFGAQVWGPLGPGGDPAMSMQTYNTGIPVRGLGYGAQVWGPLGPGGDPAMSMQTYNTGIPVRGLGQANGATPTAPREVSQARTRALWGAALGAAAGTLAGAALVPPKARAWVGAGGAGAIVGVAVAHFMDWRIRNGNGNGA